MDLSSQQESGEEFNFVHVRNEEKEVHLHIHIDVDGMMEKLSVIETKLNKLNTKENTVMADLTAIQAEVANNTNVEASAVALIQNLAGQIAAAGTDPVALGALVDQLQANDTALAQAVAANTAPPASTDDGSGLSGSVPDSGGDTGSTPPSDGSTDTGSTPPSDGSTDAGDGSTPPSDGSDTPAPGI